jgi:hypothetical protein
MDSATREKARNVLKRILAAASYDVEEVGDPLDLSAVGSEDALVVLCSDDPETIESFDFMTYRLRIGEEDWVCRKLLFTMNPEVLTEDCIRWGPDELVQQAGRAALAEVLGQRLLLDIQRPELDLPERRVEAAPPMEEGLERGPELPHLPVRVTEKRACEIAGVKGTVKCRLIPYWRYTYVSSGEREVKGRLVSFDSEGSGAINAINGLKMEINLDDIERDSTPLTPRSCPQGLCVRMWRRRSCGRSQRCSPSGSGSDTRREILSFMRRRPSSPTVTVSGSNLRLYTCRYGRSGAVVRSLRSMRSAARSFRRRWTRELNFCR